MMYIVEKRHTVGAFKTIYATAELKAAFNKLEAEMNGRDDWQPYKYDQNVIASTKSGNEHDNIILRIRQQKED